METASVREASARVIAALAAAGRSRTTIKRHEAELNAFARFLQARGQDLPTEADCLDFIAERSGARLAGLREPVTSRHAQLARRPLILLMECLDGGFPRVGQPTAPPADRCPARFRAARDEYLAECRRRGNAEASVATKQRAADLFLGYLEEAGRETPGEAEARDLAGLWARRQLRGYAPKTTGTLRSALADFLRHLHETGQVRDDLARRLPPQRYPRRGQTAPHPWTAEEVRLVLDQVDRQSAIGKRDYAMILLTARLGLRVGYDTALSHRIEAGADMFLMPSRYEPCGLNQIYSLKYGTVPVVRATGGLDDTIEDATGFKFREYSGDALLDTVRVALKAYQDPFPYDDQWVRRMRRGMEKDFSWSASAGEYVELYRRLVAG